MTKPAKTHTASPKSSCSTSSHTPGRPATSSNLPIGHELLALRAQLARAEKAQRASQRHIASAPVRPAVPQPQRASDLQGVSTDEFTLRRAHLLLREALDEARYHLCPHALQHARAEGFLEEDILHILRSGRVRAVYPQEKRWLICGFFEAHGIRLPLHVVAEQLLPGEVDIVTAFIPKQPHQIISKARLAILLRYDRQTVHSRTAVVGNRPGYRSKGKWRRAG